MTASSLPGRKAGQRVNLLNTLRGLVLDYPAGLGVVKELLQNADDAGATWLELTLDRRTHRAEAMPDPRMAERGLMGPALLARSDQSFTNEDLEHIENIGAGSKAQDSGKTGQFGKGFNTVYSLTDYPAFATRGLIRCFDPLKDAVAADGEPGREWDLAKLWDSWPDWPRAFGLDEGVSELVSESVFRLPLRCEVRGARLGQLPISAQNVLDIFEDVRRFGAALLLFVRHVLVLKLLVIHEDGTEEEVYELRTVNRDEVRAAREVLNQEEDKDPSKLLENWRAGQVPPARLYHHYFALSGAELGRECWWVAQAFEPGPSGQVLAAADDLKDINQVALPRVGAALPLDDERGALAATPCIGHLFCTLPLPNPSGLPLHFNGFFDLDTSRQNLSHGECKGDASIRVAWNQALLTYALPAIARRLLEAVPPASKEACPERVFGLWPKYPVNGPLQETAKSLSQSLAELPFLRVLGAEDGRWCTAVEVRRPAEKWTKELCQALQVDGVELVDPELPEAVVASLEKIDALPARLKPDDLRVLLTMEYSGPIGEAPLHCLRKREFVLELAKFFLQGLEDLVLQLRQDGTLRTFGQVAWMGGEEAFRILEPWPLVLLDQKLQSLLGEKQVNGVKRIHESEIPARLLDVQKYLDGQEGDRWSLGTDLSLNWIEKTVLFIAGNDPRDSREALRNLRIVPDKHGKLHALLSPKTPHPLEAGTSQKLIDSLDALGVPLMSGAPSLFDAFHYLNGKLDGEALPSLGQAIAERICQDHGKVWAGLNTETRELLLDTLAKENAKKAFALSLVQRLGKVPIWPTQHGDLRAGGAEHVFLPANFKPPRIGRGVVLFQTGRGDRWQQLLNRCGAQSYTDRDYLRQVFLEDFSALKSEDQDQAVSWLSAKKEVLRELRDSKKQDEQKLFGDLCLASIVRCTDGLLRSPSTVYHPESEVTRLLGDGVSMPDVEAAETKQKHLRLFALLGMASQPHPADLIERIGALIDERTEGLAVVEQISLLAKHLAERWEELKGETINGTPLEDHVRDLAWLPALSPKGEKTDPAGLKTPGRRFFRPAELFLSRHKDLVASQEPLSALANDSTAFQKALGVQDEVPVATAVSHFYWVMQSGEVSVAQVARCSSAFYKFLGEVKESKNRTLDSDSALRRLRRERCIWDTVSNRFLLPEHTFSVRVPFFGNLRAQIESEGFEAEGLNWLGRRGSPELEDFRSYLGDLAVETQGRPLLEEEKESALHSIKQIGALLAEGQGFSVHLLDHKDFLRKSDRLLRDDAPWWRDRMATGPVAMVGKQVPVELALRVKVPTASKALREELSGLPGYPTTECKALCEVLQRRVQHPAFLRGLRRMIFFEYQNPAPDLMRVTTLRFEPSGPLRTVLTGAPLAPDQRFGEEDVEVFLEGEVLRIAGEQLEDVLPWAANAIVRCLRFENRIVDKAPLEDMLRTGDSQDIPKVLKRRRIPELPEEEEIQTRWDNTDAPLPDSGIWEPGSSHGLGTATDAAPSGEGPPEVVFPTSHVPWEQKSSAHRPLENHLIPTGTKPSSRPGDGSSNYTSEGWGKRLRSYAEPLTTTQSQGSQEEREKLRRAAIRHVVSYEKARGIPESQISETGEKIYDLIVDSGKRERFVVVKGLDSTWGARGVALTSVQIAEASSLREKYWLYVVEHALDKDHAQVHAIQDPVGKLDQLVFDGGWAKEAEGANEEPVPEVGDKVWMGEKLLGEVIELQPSEDGKTAMMLTLRKDNSERKKTWRPSKMRLEKED